MFRCRVHISLYRTETRANFMGFEPQRQRLLYPLPYPDLVCIQTAVPRSTGPLANHKATWSTNAPVLVNMSDS